MKKVLCMILMGFLIISNVITFADKSEYGAESVIVHPTENSSNYITYSDGEEIAVPNDVILLYVDGKLVKKAKVVVRNNRSLIPLEVVERELGCNVVWNEEKREVSINKGDKIIVLKIDRNTAIVNGRQVMMDTRPILIYEDVYVPLRLVSENMGMTVGYFNPAARGESVSLNDYRTAIFVDEKYEVDNLVSREDAMIFAKERCLKGLENFKKSLRENLVSNGEDPERFQEELTLVEKSINKMEYLGEVSRYYVFDMNIYQVIYDKLKGEMYFKYDMGLATYIKWLDIDSPYLYTPLFLVG